MLARIARSPCTLHGVLRAGIGRRPKHVRPGPVARSPRCPSCKRVPQRGRSGPGTGAGTGALCPARAGSALRGPHVPKAGRSPARPRSRGGSEVRPNPVTSASMLSPSTTRLMRPGSGSRGNVLSRVCHALERVPRLRDRFLRRERRPGAAPSTAERKPSPRIHGRNSDTSSVAKLGSRLAGVRSVCPVRIVGSCRRAERVVRSVASRLSPPVMGAFLLTLQSWEFGADGSDRGSVSMTVGARSDPLGADPAEGKGLGSYHGLGR